MTSEKLIHELSTIQLTLAVRPQDIDVAIKMIADLKLELITNVNNN
jgi:hypothetical protein